ALRERLIPRLALAGLRVAWDVTTLPALDHAGPQEMLQIMRIVQEAVTNILKHAQARTLSVCARTISSAEIAIEIADDGCGIVEPRTHGRGLANMRYRAARLGGALDVESNERGTKVRL